MIRFWCKAKAMAVFTFCVGLLVFPLLYLWADGVRQRQRDRSNLEQLAEAMQDYHDANGCLPAANAYPTKDGKSGLSWRVALLPYLGEVALFRKFRLDEPWDSPHNLRLLPRMPKVYRMPGRKGNRPGLTHYQVFVGPGAVFLPRQNAPGLPRLPGSAAPGLCTARTPVAWTMPDDLPFDPARPLPALGAWAGKDFHVALCDGTVYWVTDRIPEKVLRQRVITYTEFHLNW